MPCSCSGCHVPGQDAMFLVRMPCTNPGRRGEPELVQWSNELKIGYAWDAFKERVRASW